MGSHIEYGCLSCRSPKIQLILCEGFPANQPNEAVPDLQAIVDSLQSRYAYMHRLGDLPSLDTFFLLVSAITAAVVMGHVYRVKKHTFLVAS